MIREHAFNSAWWGEPVGFIADPGFFALDLTEQHALLAPYAWAEFRAPLELAPPIGALLRARFAQFDTQIDFRIGLHAIQSTPSLDALEVRFGDADRFAIPTGASAPFVHERFLQVPGATLEKLDERYTRWANELIARQPEYCAQILHQSAPQGWFLAERSDQGLRLSLAMVHRDARISGMYIYQKALVAYAARGARIGHASFSIRNVAVHNIWARLGATFRQAVGCWLWVRNDVADSKG